MSQTGHCLCGNTTFEFDGDPTWACYCHCDSCRRNCSAPVTAFLGLPEKRFRWTGQEPATYESTPSVRRRFCSTCGTPMAFEADHYPGEIHLYIASLDDPHAISPQMHVHHEERLSWFETDDDLKRISGFHTGTEHEQS